MQDDPGWFPRSQQGRSCAGTVGWDIYPQGSGVADRTSLVALAPLPTRAREGGCGCEHGGVEGCVRGRAAFLRREWGTLNPGCSAGAGPLGNGPGSGSGLELASAPVAAV